MKMQEKLDKYFRISYNYTKLTERLFIYEF